MTCLHKKFISSVNINRLTNDDGIVTSYSADIMITCAECGAKFRFRGVPAGFSYGHPTCSVDSTELRVPITALPEPQFSSDAYGKKAKEEWEKLH